ncbi:MAG: ribonuclease III [Puniceicoccales bacterium]|nr:ribonuclease III [Puniceicoccales bacterium]
MLISAPLRKKMMPTKQMFLRIFDKFRHAATEYSGLEQSLGFYFKDMELLRTALTHPCYKSYDKKIRDYQRLEFLGDAVLGLVFAEALYITSDAEEGKLTEARICLARGSNLAGVAKRLQLGRYLRLPPNYGEAKNIRIGNNTNEDALEALFGAIFLDGGLEAARRVAQHLFGDKLVIGNSAGGHSPKNRLQELIQRDKRPAKGTCIEYRMVAETGPAHARQFTVEAWVGGKCLGRGHHNSKRVAGEMAAEMALKHLSQKHLVNALQGAPETKQGHRNDKKA